MSLKGKIAKNVSLPIIDAVIANPLTPMPLKGAWVAFRIAYCLFDDLYPTESQKFLKQVRENIISIGIELYSSKEFQQSLTITFESLLRTRGKEKRDLIKKTFLNCYISEEDRQKVALERFYRIIEEISLEAVEHLNFIDREIIPMRIEEKQKEISKMDQSNFDKEHTKDWWLKTKIEGTSLSLYIDKWIHNAFNLKNQIVNIDFAVNKIKLNHQIEGERNIRKRFSELSNELVSLGIFRSGSAIGGDVYTFTGFGYKFLEMIKSTSQI